MEAKKTQNKKGLLLRLHHTILFQTSSNDIKTFNVGLKLLKSSGQEEDKVSGDRVSLGSVTVAVAIKRDYQ